MIIPQNELKEIIDINKMSEVYTNSYEFWAVHRKFKNFHEVFVPDIDDAIGAGDTYEDAYQNAKFKLLCVLDHMKSMGKRIPQPSSKEIIHTIAKRTIDEQNRDFPTETFNIVTISVDMVPVPTLPEKELAEVTERVMSIAKSISQEFKILVFISGFGQPHKEHKMEILEHNLKQLHQTKPNKSIIDVWIAQYDDSFIITDEFNPYISGKLTIFHEKGFVGHFIRTIATPERVKEYDYILCLMDDVELDPNINLEEMIHVKEEWNLNIVSPSMSQVGKAQFRYMFAIEDPNLYLRMTNACEYFCYLMDYNSYCRYHSYFHEDNPYMWGMDGILVKHIKLRVALLNKMTMTHYYKNENYTNFEHTYLRFVEYIARYGETPDSLANTPAIGYLVYRYSPI